MSPDKWATPVIHYVHQLTNVKQKLDEIREAKLLLIMESISHATMMMTFRCLLCRLVDLWLLLKKLPTILTIVSFAAVDSIWLLFKFWYVLVTVVYSLFQMKWLLKPMEENMWPLRILATTMELLVTFTAFCTFDNLRLHQFLHI